MASIAIPKVEASFATLFIFWIVMGGVVCPGNVTRQPKKISWLYTVLSLYV